MLKIANAILIGVGYNQLDKIHNVSVNSAQLYDVQPNVVEGQIVSFACMESIPSSANVSVKDSDNNNVSFTITDMTNADYYQDPQWDIKAMITFIAPNKDITITIS